MKTIGQAFEEFLSKLELTASERDEASRQHTNMRIELQKRMSVADNFLSGSYARKTAIRPLNDIDIFLVLKPTDDLHCDSKPSAVLRAVYDVLCEIYPTKSPKIQARSVGIEFSGTGIAYDVVPAFTDLDYSDAYRIPDIDGSEWIRTNPKIHRERSTSANEAANKKLKPLFKAIKHANNIHGKKARSFHLEVLSWSILASDPGSFLNGLVTLVRGIDQAIELPCPDPAGLGPDVRPSTAKLREAKAWIAKMKELTDEAKRYTDDGETGKAHRALREMFGSEWPEKGTSGRRSRIVVGGGSVDDSGSRFG